MKIKIAILVLALALLLAVAGVALAGDGVEVPRQVLSGGASDAGGGGVTLRATLGQSVTGIVANSGGDVTVGQGFWHGGIYDDTIQVYLPVILRAPAGE